MSAFEIGGVFAGEMGWVGVGRRAAPRPRAGVSAHGATLDAQGVPAGRAARWGKRRESGWGEVERPGSRPGIRPVAVRDRERSGLYAHFTLISGQSRPRTTGDIRSVHRMEKERLTPHSRGRTLMEAWWL
ncbi:hypothetical protein Mame01_10710 [Microbispora amethystogenes]|nr:hypothetical protein Mame01_10710 [Microbispora amethystogenes]